jgi:hypothetical protein
MTDEELTCGQELAASAEVPEAIGALMRHVSSNLEAHARWVGVATPPARHEHDAMLGVAEAYRAIATAAEDAAAVMRSFHNLEPAPHDEAGFDRAGFVSWMRAKIELQKSLASLLMDHAALSEKALDRSK